MLEEILLKSETDFDFPRTMQENKKYPQLTKYLFAYSDGVKSSFGTEHRSEASSVGTFKKSSVEALALLSSEQTGAAADSGPAVLYSESWKLADKKFKELQAARLRLAKCLEDIQQCIADVQALSDKTYDKKLKDLGGAKDNLEQFLQTVRVALAAGLPEDKAAECEEVPKKLSVLCEQAAAHERFQRNLPPHEEFAAVLKLLSSKLLSSFAKTYFCCFLHA